MLDLLLSRFSDAPCLVSAGQQKVFEGCLSALSKSEHAEELVNSDISASDEFWFHEDDWRSSYRPYKVVNGILQVPVRGVLLHDFPWQYGSYATGYQYIWKAIQRGLADPEVQGIALLIHSPGGEVAGCFDLVDRMFDVRDQKPIRAFAHEYAYSAAYAIASVAPHIVVSRTGGVGSIGVVTAHVDVSKAFDNIGIKVTFIHFGAHKVDGNSYEPLPDDVKARIQARIDELGEVFVATVARNRDMDAQVIRDTEALTYSASEAVSNGLADSIGPLDDAMAAFAADLSVNEGDEQMSDKTNAVVDQAAIETARAEGVAEGHKNGHAEGLKEGMTAERSRISTILGSDEAKNRPQAALAAALDTEMSAEQAATFLAKLPEEAKPETAGAGKDNGQDFSKAMTDTENPNVGATADKEGEDEDDDSTSVVAFAQSHGLPGIRKRKA